jgi:hypothetical protein
MYYDDDFSLHEGIIIDKVVSFNVFIDHDEEESVRKFIQAEGGILVRQDGGRIYDDPYSDLDDLKIPEPMEWVTPMTTYNRKEGVFATCGDKMRICDIYGDACMIVRIGKAGDRLAYPTVAQIEKAYEQSGYGSD